MTEHISSLELSWRLREGSQNQTRVEYLDFVVDGDSLGDALRANDYIGCLGWGGGHDRVQQLLLTTPAELETGRRLLYVCPECGDAGCGALTVAIDEDGDSYVWKQFALERTYHLDDGPLFDLSEYDGVGPFRFDKRKYHDALTNWPLRR